MQNCIFQHVINSMLLVIKNNNDAEYITVIKVHGSCMQYYIMICHLKYPELLYM